MVSDIGKGLMFLVMSALLFNKERNVDLFVSLVITVVGLLNILIGLVYSDYEEVGFAQDVKDDDENESLLSFYMKQNNAEKALEMEVDREMSSVGSINSQQPFAIMAKPFDGTGGMPEQDISADPPAVEERRFKEIKETNSSSKNSN